ESLEGIEIKPITRVDECCGFGGTFAVAERETSVAMGVDRVTDHISSGSEVMVAGDMSCLMHMSGLIRRRNMPMSVKHVAEVLNEAIQSDSSGLDRSSSAMANQ
ncbi:(Fe-S)-binding protein, partial [Rhodopirellula bahusiensis]